MNTKAPPVLTPLEARVISVLIEKEHTVPDSYPLTLNMLVTGCNQKTSRDPVMNATEAQVQEAIDSLRRMSLVIESSGGRAMRYAQNFKRVLGVPGESVALLAMLMLRGPQTAGELRINCERLQKFSDISAVEGFLEELAGWSAGALAVLLPRAPGAREPRWTHLLCGPLSDEQMAAIAASASSSSGSGGVADVSVGEIAALKATVARLEGEVQSLRDVVTRLCAELGVQ